MPEKNSNIQITDDFRIALDALENTSGNYFITGNAGTGKSTLLEIFREQTSKTVVVLAPTGVAALNVRGQTIHSFFKFKPGITLEQVKKEKAQIYKKIDTIIIDEASMVRADLLDCMEYFMRQNGKSRKQPFGGAQVIFFGDLHQLPPIVTNSEKEYFCGVYKSQYFFDAKCFRNMDVKVLELKTIFRQKDEKFIKFLNSVRHGVVEDHQIITFNKSILANKLNQKLAITLTTTNLLAKKINDYELSALDSRKFTSKAIMEGKFTKEYLPTDQELEFKVGAQVMMLNNDPKGRWVNGSLAQISGLTRSDDGGDPTIHVRLESGEIEDVEPFTWEVEKYFFDKELNSLGSEVVGSFKQYPFMLAWAVTIHKSQGKTFDNVAIDLGFGTFAPGQLYVALSRCRTMEGITLARPIRKRDVICDERVNEFLSAHSITFCAENQLPKKIAFIKEAIKSKTQLKICYTKADGVKSERVVTPKTVGEMDFQGNSFLGMTAFDSKSQEVRTFRLDRIESLEAN